MAAQQQDQQQRAGSDDSRERGALRTSSLGAPQLSLDGADLAAAAAPSSSGAVCSLDPAAAPTSAAAAAAYRVPLLGSGGAGVGGGGDRALWNAAAAGALPSLWLDRTPATASVGPDALVRRHSCCPTNSESHHGRSAHCLGSKKSDEAIFYSGPRLEMSFIHRITLTTLPSIDLALRRPCSWLR